MRARRNGSGERVLFGTRFIIFTVYRGTGYPIAPTDGLPGYRFATAIKQTVRDFHSSMPS